MKKTFARLMAKVFLNFDAVDRWLVACVTLGAGECVNILGVVITLFARHLEVSPDWFGKVRDFWGELFYVQFFVWSLLHGYLLSLKNITLDT
jgi:hypothetical protein